MPLMMLMVTEVPAGDGVGDDALEDAVGDGVEPRYLVDDPVTLNTPTEDPCPALLDPEEGDGVGVDSGDGSIAGDGVGELGLGPDGEPLAGDGPLLILVTLTL